MHEYGHHLVTKLSLEELLESAGRIRERYFGDQVELCGIINARCGKCPMDCKFCSQSAHYETEISSYPMLEPENMFDQATKYADSGIARCGLVTSGESPDEKEFFKILKTIERMRDAISPCASLGKVDYENLVRLKEVGLRRYHHNLETSQEFYPRICSTQSWLDRFRTACDAKNTGLELCSGGLFGLGESWSDRIELALALRDLEVDSVPINFFDARKGTPFEDIEPLPTEEALKIIALFRHLLPKSSIRVCGGRMKILGEKHNLIYAAGADAVMSGNYLTTKGNGIEEDRETIKSLALNIRH